MKLSWKLCILVSPFLLVSLSSLIGVTLVLSFLGNSDLPPVTPLYKIVLISQLVLVGLLTLLVPMFVRRTVGRRLHRLTGIMQEIVETGDLSPRTDDNEPDEIGAMARAFDSLVANLATEREKTRGHQRELETQVREKTRHLESDLKRVEGANAFITRFLASVSHELRTPLNSILGYTEILMDPATTASDRELALRVVQRNGFHLVDLANAVLDLSRIEAGEFDLEEKRSSLSQILRDVVSVIWVKAQEKKIELREVYETRIPEFVVCDSTRLRQVLINLLGNAVKFTDRGVVSLHVAVDEEQPGKGRQLRFHVRDTGIGIPADQLELIFQPFQRLATPDGSTREGTGLGLSICRQIARLMAGDVSVKSVLGKGTEFSFAVRCEVPNDTRWLKEPSRAVLSESLEGRRTRRLKGRILVADDSEDNLHLLAYHLKEAGATVDPVVNGRQAVELSRKREFDLLLLDVEMPLLDGYRVVSELRRDGIRTPMIALTGHAMKGDRERCLEAGFDDYLAKPVSREALLNLTASYLGGVGGGGDESPEVEEEAGIPEDLMREFLDHLGNETQALTAAWNEPSPSQLRAVAHRLKGTAGGFGFSEISTLAADFESCLRGEDPGRKETAYLELLNACQKVADEIRSEA